MSDKAGRDLAQLRTEQVDAKFALLDVMTVPELLEVMNESDSEVPIAVAKVLPTIGAAIEDIVERMMQGGRLIYMGAGTSGRLGVLDAAECGPTFSVTPDEVIASAEVDAKNVPLNYTVTWTARTVSHAIDDGTFYDFGLKLKWDVTPQTIAFPTTQICYAPGKKPLYLQWNITDGSSKPATEDTEFGPAPTVTTIAAPITK
jgi:hypothetical protein